MAHHDTHLSRQRIATAWRGHQVGASKQCSSLVAGTGTGAPGVHHLAMHLPVGPGAIEGGPIGSNECAHSVFQTVPPLTLIAISCKADPSLTRPPDTWPGICSLGREKLCHRVPFQKEGKAFRAKSRLPASGSRSAKWGWSTGSIIRLFKKHPVLQIAPYTCHRACKACRSGCHFEPFWQSRDRAHSLAMRRPPCRGPSRSPTPQSTRCHHPTHSCCSHPQSHRSGAPDPQPCLQDLQMTHPH